MEAIPPGLLEGVGIAGILVFLFWLIATGRLSTRREVDDLRHDRDQWRTESRIKDQTIADLTKQNADMLNAFGPTLTDFLEGLRRAGINNGNGGQS